MFHDKYDREHPLSIAYIPRGSDDLMRPYHDPLGDVFGTDVVDQDRANTDDSLEVTDGPNLRVSGEHSEIPRLRSIHVTNGYREGISESKSTFVQAGFDEGYSLGAVLGFKSAWLLAFLELATNYQLVSNDHLVDAKRDLGLQQIFSNTFFDEDGIWKYHVPGHEAEQNFERVASEHPSIQKWTTSVQHLISTWGLNAPLLNDDHQDGN
ncbi:hypothetical protein CAC42_4322 [Sphaceloma murrayae]|uniref:Protein YAE1 n=1 Tax=Sphaceloma murrayae TaxID=2082308 RepID=A0A2K1QLS7_9PEZI|nr:hypothetical protein CAC42_4322 [Sphaceloma murrayae]